MPKLGSLILKHEWDAEIRGLKEWPPQERPPVAIVFYAFRIMVAIGFLMLFAGLAGLLLWWRGRLFSSPWFLLLCMALTPSGFVAVLTGWVTAEVGRQPYVVYGLMRTADAVSPVSGASVAISLAVFVLAYAAVFGAGTWYLLRLIRHGPEAPPAIEDHPSKTARRPLSLPDEAMQPAE